MNEGSLVKQQAGILLIDDDRRLAEMVVRYLGQSGYQVAHRETGASGLQALTAQVPDLVLLDLMLPDADGLDLCRQIRQMPGAAATVPVLMLTARGETTDRIVGLEMGADDYLPKPFEPRELLARVRALLRRAATPAASAAGDDAMTGVVEAVAGGTMGVAGRSVPGDRRTFVPDEPPEILVLDDLEIDIGAHEVRVGGERRTLTSYQFELLLALARHAGRVMSRERLMDLVKGEPLEAFDRSIDVHVGKIRQAIETDPRQPQRLLTVRGVGYVFARPKAAQG
ncbi:MAG: response regulator transcription factor [Lautropia sp.]|nr:response regulator transcription factor [Lautropia sp.]